MAQADHATTGEHAPQTLGRSVAIDRAAQLLGVSRRTIYNRIRDGRLQTIRTVGGSQRVTVESLHQLSLNAHPATASVSSPMPAVARLERSSE